jgi:hypothetical protein
MLSILKVMAIGLLCAVVFLIIAFWSQSSLLSFMAFGPGDETFLYALNSGLIMLIFGRTGGEAPHHLYVLYCSLLFWWFVSMVVVSVVRHILGRMRT